MPDNINYTDIYNFIQKYQIKKRLIWDSTQPMFVYNEEPVMTFTEYLCFFGGLIGLWFGTSAKDIIVLLAKYRFWIEISSKVHLFLNWRNRVVNFR